MCFRVPDKTWMSHGACWTLQVDVVLVMDQDRLLTQLTERLKVGPATELHWCTLLHVSVMCFS